MLRENETTDYSYLSVLSLASSIITGRLSTKCLAVPFRQSKNHGRKLSIFHSTIEKISFNKYYVMRKLLIVSMMFFLTQSLMATDGYFSLGYGAIHKGMAGAGIGLPYTALINGNPAANVYAGKTFSLGVAFFSPLRQYTVEGNPSGLPTTFGLLPGTVKSDSKLFLVPHLASNWMINDKSSFAVSIFGHGGMNTNYPTRTFFDQSVEQTGVNLIQLFLGLSYAYKVADRHSLGLTALVSGQSFSAEGLSNFGPFSSDPTKLTNNGSSTTLGIGFKLGYHGELSDQFQVGAVYQSKTITGGFDDYSGLFAESGGFDIPASWTAGIVYSPVSALRIALDFKQILYSQVASIANPIDPMALPPAFLNPGGNPNNPGDYTPNPNYTPLGSDNGSGFGWEDMSVFKVGMEYDVSDSFTLRAGFSKGNQPVPDTEVLFNILAPGVIENHLALGMSKTLGEGGRKIHFSINHALNHTVTGFNPFDFDPVLAQQGQLVPNQNIILEMKQWDFEIQYTF